MSPPFSQRTGRLGGCAFPVRTLSCPELGRKCGGFPQATKGSFEQHQELWRVFMARWGSCPWSFPCSYVIQVFLWIWETPVVILGWLDERASNQASPAQRAAISISTFISGCLTRDTTQNNSDRSESGGGSEVAITLTWDAGERSSGPSPAPDGAELQHHLCRTPASPVWGTWPCGREARPLLPCACRPCLCYNGCMHTSLTKFGREGGNNGISLRNVVSHQIAPPTPPNCLAFVILTVSCWGLSFRDSLPQN